MAFDVTIDQTNTPVSEGETLIVDYTVTNTGSSSDTQTIELHIVSTTTGTIIDSFERTSLDHYTGDTGGFQISDESNVTPNSIDGTRLLECTSGVSEINSTSGLNNYFAKGEVAHAYVYGANLVTNGASAFTYFGSSGTELDGYAIDIRESTGGNVRLIEWSSGSSNILDTADPTLSDDTWYRIEITWDDGSLGGSDNDITAEVYDHGASSLIATVTGNDSTHATNTGIGFRSNDPDVFWDFYNNP